MLDPNALDSLLPYEAEMQSHLAENAPDLLDPYGAEQMIDVSPDMAVGMLACIYGLNTEVDDSPDGATNSDDNYTLLEGRYTQDQVDSLF